MIPDEHKYNPHHHHRRSIRLKGYDYSAAGAYFITICCHKKECHFGKIENGAMKLNDNGTIAYDEWNKLQKRFPYFELDVFQIMPNHIHAIVVLTDFPTKSAYVGAGFTPALPPKITQIQNDATAGFTPALPPKITQIQDDVATEFAPDLESRAGTSPTPTPVGDIIGTYKSLVAKECLNIYKAKSETMGKLWQRNYFEHIIRNHKSYQSIADYIINNTANWNTDKLFMK